MTCLLLSLSRASSRSIRNAWAWTQLVKWYLWLSHISFRPGRRWGLDRTFASIITRQIYRVCHYLLGILLTSSGRTIASSIVWATKVCLSSYEFCSTPRTLWQSYWCRCRLLGWCSIDWPISLPTYYATGKCQSCSTEEWVTGSITYPSEIVPVVRDSRNCPHYLLHPISKWFTRFCRIRCST